MKKWMRKIIGPKAYKILLEILSKKEWLFNFGKFEFALFFNKNKKEESLLENTASTYFERVDWYRNSHSFMFIEDTYHSVMPHYSFSKPDQFLVKLKAADPALEKMLVDTLSDDTRAINLTHAFSEFMQGVSQNLFYYGQSLYEMSVEKNLSGEYTSIEFTNLMPLNIKKFFGFYVQYTFPGIAKKLNRNPKLTVVLSSKVFRLQFPKELGGKRNLFKILKRMKKLYKEIFPKFHIDDSLENKMEFDSTKFFNSREREIAILVKEFGWDQRESLSGKSKGTEYFTIARALKFEEAMAIMRASVLTQLNNFLKSELKIENELMLEGLPTVEKINSLEEKLYEGGINVGNFVQEMRGI